MIHVTCRLTAKNRDQLQNPMLANRATFLSLFTVLNYPVLVKNLPVVVIFQPSTILCKSCGTCTCRTARPHRSNEVPRCGLLLQIYRGLYVCWAKQWAVLKWLNQSRCHLDLGLHMEPCISVRWRPECTMERGNFGASPGWLWSIVNVGLRCEPVIR